MKPIRFIEDDPIGFIEEINNIVFLYVGKKHLTDSFKLVINNFKQKYPDIKTVVINQINPELTAFLTEQNFHVLFEVTPKK